MILAEESVLIHTHSFWTMSPPVGDLYIAHELAAGSPAAPGRPPGDATTQRPVPAELPELLSQTMHCWCVCTALTAEKGPVLLRFPLLWLTTLEDALLTTLSLKLMGAKSQHPRVCHVLYDLQWILIIKAFLHKFVFF